MPEMPAEITALWAELQTYMVPGAAESIAEVDWMQAGCVLVLSLLGSRAIAPETGGR